MAACLLPEWNTAVVGWDTRHEIRFAPDRAPVTPALSCPSPVSRLQAPDFCCNAVEKVLHPADNLLHDLEKSLHALEEALHTLEKSLHTLEEALHIPEEALHILEKSLHTLEESLHILEKSPYILEKSLHTLELLRCALPVTRFSPVLFQKVNVFAAKPGEQTRRPDGCAGFFLLGCAFGEVFCRNCGLGAAKYLVGAALFPVDAALFPVGAAHFPGNCTENLRAHQASCPHSVPPAFRRAAILDTGDKMPVRWTGKGVAVVVLQR